MLIKAASIKPARTAFRTVFRILFISKFKCYICIKIAIKCNMGSVFKKSNTKLFSLNSSYFLTVNKNQLQNQHRYMKNK